MSRKSWFLVALALCLTSSVALSKKKEKPVVPELLLRAQTMVVLIQPDAGEPMNEPTANRKAREDVEKAFMSWGRYRLVQEAQSADIVVTVKKGSEKATTPTVNGGPVDQRPVTMETTDNQIRIGAQQGRPINGSQAPDQTAPEGRAHPGVEAGSSDDSFLVYQGGDSYTPYSAPLWSYNAKNGLRAPDVKAVQEFRKVITEAEKAAAAAQKQPPAPQQKTP
ncbi:MAG TPA: hypothetical protein VGH37_05145 [Candidatus Acidoferrum sp.]|jgi:hypothetical protein